MSIEEIIKQAKETKSWLSHRLAAKKIKILFESQKNKAAVRVAFLSSFTIEPLVDYVVVEAAEANIQVDTYLAGYDQLNQEILDENSKLYKFSPDVTVLIVEHSEKYDAPEIISLAKAFSEKKQGLLVVGNFPAEPQWPLHIIDDEKTQALRRANQTLAEALHENSKIQICDIDSLAAYYGYSNALSPQMLHMARMPFSEGFLSLLAKKIISHIKAAKNLMRKCLVLDCDNTIWGGIIGEDGIDGIHLGPDSPGREFVDFQKAILELYHQGVILAINSKNNYDDVMEVLDKHPHMVLREKHFAGIQINWDDKPTNMQRLAEQINIGIDSFVFLDDNPAEREMMRQILPQVYTMELPPNPSLYAKTLRQSNQFAKAYLTEEDRKRGEIYAAQRKREKLKTTITNLKDFLKSLEMTASIRTAKKTDIKRIAQLTQRTNQFNLTTRRYSEADITSMINNKDWTVYVLGLKDKFGDNGTVGLAIVKKENKTSRIDTFLMSCRVIGRGAEDALLNRILTDVTADKTETVQAEYIKTAKNNIVADFWEKMGFETIKSNDEHSLYSFNTSGFKHKKIDYLKVENQK